MYDNEDCPYCGEEIDYEELHEFYCRYSDDRLMSCPSCSKFIRICAEPVIEFHLEKGGGE